MPASSRDVAGLRAESGPASDPLFWMLLAIGGDGDARQLVSARAGRAVRRRA